MPLPTWLVPLLGLLAVAAVFVALPYSLALGAQLRRPRPVRCPETGSAEVVGIGVARQAVYSFLPVCDPVKLCACTRWPARAGCDQACARQL